MPKFLNRLLALPITELEDRIAANIEQAMEAGSYETVAADSLAVVGRKTLYAHPSTDAATELVEIIRCDRLEPPADMTGDENF